MWLLWSQCPRPSHPPIFFFCRNAKNNPAKRAQWASLQPNTPIAGALHILYDTQSTKRCLNAHYGAFSLTIKVCFLRNTHVCVCVCKYAIWVYLSFYTKRSCRMPRRTLAGHRRVTTRCCFACTFFAYIQQLWFWMALGARSTSTSIQNVCENIPHSSHTVCVCARSADDFDDNRDKTSSGVHYIHAMGRTSLYVVCVWARGRRVVINGIRSFNHEKRCVRRSCYSASKRAYLLQ